MESPKMASWKLVAITEITKIIINYNYVTINLCSRKTRLSSADSLFLNICYVTWCLKALSLNLMYQYI